MFRCHSYLDERGFASELLAVWTWTYHIEMMCARRWIIGLLQSQDMDWKPTFGFVVMVDAWFFVWASTLKGGNRFLSKTTEHFEYQRQRGLLEGKLGLSLVRVPCFCPSHVLKELRKSVDRVFMEAFSSRNRIKKYPLPGPPPTTKMMSSVRGSAARKAGWSVRRGCGSASAHRMNCMYQFSAKIIYLLGRSWLADSVLRIL